MAVENYTLIFATFLFTSFTYAQDCGLPSLQIITNSHLKPLILQAPRKKIVANIMSSRIRYERQERAWHLLMNRDGSESFELPCSIKVNQLKFPENVDF